MSTPFKLSNYAGTIDIQPALEQAGEANAKLFEGFSVPFKIATANGETTIDVGGLSKKDLEILGERAAAAFIGSHLEAALGVVAEKPSKK